jgi:hypothetical protein
VINERLARAPVVQWCAGCGIEGRQALHDPGPCALVPGDRADLMELDEDLRVRRVMRTGTWVTR